MIPLDKFYPCLNINTYVYVFSQEDSICELHASGEAEKLLPIYLNREQVNDVGNGNRNAGL
jgi:hypothetical protein